MFNTHRVRFDDFTLYTSISDIDVFPIPVIWFERLPHKYINILNALCPATKTSVLMGSQHEVTMF